MTCRWRWSRCCEDVVRRGARTRLRRAVRGTETKRFAGILGAAPSVAIAGIVVGSLAKGPLDEAAAARTMIAGAVALTVCAAVLVPAGRRWAVGRASMVGCAAWILVALVLYPVVG